MLGLDDQAVITYNGNMRDYQSQAAFLFSRDAYPDIDTLHKLQMIMIFPLIRSLLLKELTMQEA